jgi:DNA processing protein
MLQYQIALTMLPGIGDISGKKLVAYCGGLEKVFNENKAGLQKYKMLGDAIIRRLVDGRADALRRAEKEIRFIEKYKIKTFFFLDKEYPYRLSNCIDAPVMLYYKGNANLNPDRVIGIVGTRKATEYGKETCLKIIDGLSDTGALVVSGLAFGIDSCAHKNALTHNLPTVAVLGHGLDRIYPPQNKGLAQKLLQNGGLLTDFQSETNPDRENFPKRNRIIAGLCDALVVIEAAETGGALITADIANSYNRDVFAIPGRVGDEYSKGCNKFIKTHRAALIETAEDLKYLMGWDTQKNKKSGKQQELFIELTSEEQTISGIIRTYGDVGIDTLVIDSGMTSSTVAKTLLNLEFKGVLRSMPGKRYQLI